MTSVPEFYGRWARLYDVVATAPGVGRWRRRAAERVADPGDVVVEMGCGSGANLPPLADRVGPEGRVVGVDLTGPLLDIARGRTRGLDHVDVLRGDATRPPVAPGAVDAVLATFVCGLFADPAAVVDGWCDLVGSGGRVALMDATRSERPLGRPLNPLFATFTAVGEPGSGVGDVLRAPVGGHDGRLRERVDAARRALTARTVERSYETFGLGFVGLQVGRVA